LRKIQEEENIWLTNFLEDWQKDKFHLNLMTGHKHALFGYYWTNTINWKVALLLIC